MSLGSWFLHSMLQGSLFAPAMLPTPGWSVHEILANLPAPHFPALLNGALALQTCVTVELLGWVPGIELMFSGLPPGHLGSKYKVTHKPCDLRDGHG